VAGRRHRLGQRRGPGRPTADAAFQAALDEEIERLRAFLGLAG
jgi:hypothetical protein